MIGSEVKAKVAKDLGKNEKDTGSAATQIGILTARIKDLTEHMKVNKKDYHSRRGLLQMVGKRKKLLKYLHDTDFEQYKEVITKLGLRR